MEKQRLTFVNRSNNEDPKFADIGSSGFDLRAWITEANGGDVNIFTKTTELTIKPFERKLIHTGLYFDIPQDTEMQVRPRSGFALKRGLTIANTPATIDESYTGEVCVILVNISDKPIVIENGDRIAQAVLCPVYNGSKVELSRVDAISKDTDRGSGGFGHSGFH